jgi:VanZ family protein
MGQPKVCEVMVSPVRTRSTLGNTFRWLTVGYAVVLLFVTHVPGLSVSFGEATPVEADKILHFVAYAVLGFLLGLNVVFETPLALAPAALAILALGGFALVDELPQPIFGRVTDVLDWVADVVGAFMGLAFVWLSSLAWMLVQPNRPALICRLSDNEMTAGRIPPGKQPQ